MRLPNYKAIESDDYVNTTRYKIEYLLPCFLIFVDFVEVIIISKKLAGHS